jgi:hypothetical protein
LAGGAEGCGADADNTEDVIQRRDAEIAEISAEKTNRNVFSALPLRSVRLCGEIAVLFGSGAAA